VIAITGGSSGIGLATAETVLARGGRVAIMARHQERLTEAIEHLRLSAADAHAAAAYCGDASDDDDLGRFLDLAGRELGGLDGLVACAGSTMAFDLLSGDLSEWQRALDANLTSALLSARAAATRLPPGGSIVLLGSMAARRVSRVSVAYGVAKAGVSLLSRALALSLADRQVRVNCLVPGFVDTPMTQEGFRVRGEGDPHKELRVRQAVEASLPAARLAQPREIAEVIAFLLSSRASYLTGAEILVDGGELASFGQLPPGGTGDGSA
jgi:2-deoxy-D-gluconate 3-dehydrogenase